VSTSAAKKASTKVAAKKVPAKKVAAKKVAAKKVAAKAPARKVPARKAPVKKAVAATAPVQKAPVKKAPVKKAPAQKAPAQKAVAATASARKAPAQKAAAAKAPVKKVPPKKVFDTRFLESQEALLYTERKRFLRDADILTEEANSLAELREPGDVQFDEESGEGDTLAVERQRDLLLSAQFRGQIEEIDRALHKMEIGTYGICEVSGTPIPRERLKAIPWARERVEYKVGGFGRR